MAATNASNTSILERIVANTAASAASAAAANAAERAEFEAFRRLVDRDAATGNNLGAQRLAVALRLIDHRHRDDACIPPRYMRAIRRGGGGATGQYRYDRIADAICRAEFEHDEDGAYNSDGNSMPQPTAEPPCSPPRLVTCAICLEHFQPSRLVTLPCCAESESTSSTRFCPGCIAGLAHHDMIMYHFSSDEIAANYGKSTCVVGECPRCKKLLSVTNRFPLSYHSRIMVATLPPTFPGTSTASD